MLQSYAAIYKHGHLEWLDDAPTQENVQVIVTFVQPSKKKTANSSATDFTTRLGLC
ncbi:MAG: hypothetical protein RL236_2055 [Pseudomonadota bacterium]|jgi:hypothetical protein